MDIQTIYQDTIRFAAAKHGETGQKIPGTELPYLVHLCNVAMEVMVAYQNSPDFRLDLAIKIALLHDTLEDTSATHEELSQHYGKEVADAVMALTKNEELQGPEQIPDSLSRIRTQPKEVWIVKLADRITNLQPPPEFWDRQRKKEYRDESLTILNQLIGSNPFLELRLLKKIEGYQKYL